MDNDMQSPYISSSSNSNQNSSQNSSQEQSQNYFSSFFTQNSLIVIGIILVIVFYLLSNSKESFTISGKRSDPAMDDDLEDQLDLLDNMQKRNMNGY